MRFVRLAKINLAVPASTLEPIRWPLDGFAVVPLKLYRETEHASSLIVGAETDAAILLATDDDSISIPDVLLEETEKEIESFASVLAVALESSQSIEGVSPAGALIGENEEEHQWLEGKTAIRARSGMLIRALAKPELPLIQEVMSERSDGVALLAEGLSHKHPSGRFHEFWRLFELAFRMQGQPLVRSLGSFLGSAPHQGFSMEEVVGWYELRNPLTHAMIPRDSLVLQRSTRPVVTRMEQAAYDVLLNKEEWSTNSISRRPRWLPEIGLASPDGPDIFAIQGRGIQQAQSTALDQFGAYPLTTGISKHIPVGWWARFAEQRFDTQVSIVVPEDSPGQLASQNS